MAEASYPPRHLTNLSFEDFRRMASDESLSDAEKIGFPDAMRAGFEAAILGDITQKLGITESGGKTVLDIGIGSGALGRSIINHCRVKGQKLFAVDSKEMLATLTDADDIIKIPGQFPDLPNLSDVDLPEHGFDAVIVYSVLQHVFLEASVFDFLDAAVSFLAPGGRLLLGDIPNTMMLKRFLSSDRGIAHHHKFMNATEPPDVRFNTLERGRMDDSVVLALLGRARAAGYDAWVLPQPETLPFYQRREDILIQRP